LEIDNYDGGLLTFGYTLYTPLALPCEHSKHCNSKLEEVYSYETQFLCHKVPIKQLFKVTSFQAITYYSINWKVTYIN